MNLDQQYIARQLDQVLEREDGGYLLKIVGEQSQTKYLPITAADLARIREVLTGPPEHPLIGVEYLNTKGAAAHLRVSVSTVGKWVRSGVLRPTWTTRGGHARFTKDDLDRHWVQPSR